MRVLVTGGAGFIGSHVVEQLLERGADVVVLDRADPATRPSAVDLSTDAEYRWRDLQDPDACLDAVRGVDAVCHLAAKVGPAGVFADVRSFVGHNDAGTATLLWALHHHDFRGRVVLGSSMEVYGEGAYVCPEHGEVRPGPRSTAELAAGRFEPPCPQCGRAVVSTSLDEDARPEPRTVYASTKLHQEHLARCYANDHPGTVVTALRYHNVYGPGMPSDTAYEGVASIFRRQIEQGTRPQVFEDGAQRRDFVHVRDVARATVLALTHPTGYDGALNVSTGRPCTLLELATALCVARDSRLWPEVVGAFRPNDVRHLTANPARAAAALGFRAEVGLPDGVAQFARLPVS